MSEDNLPDLLRQMVCHDSESDDLVSWASRVEFVASIARAALATGGERGPQ